MRKKIVAGNWKMNLTKAEALHLATAFDDSGFDSQKVEVVVFAPSVFLDALSALSLEAVVIGAQNFYPAANGAFTGELSLAHLNDLNIQTVLVGHSERRMFFDENHVFLKQKVDSALEHGMRVFFCCGEPEEIRMAEKQNNFVEKQLRDSLLHLTADQLSKVVIAYEPVWAIGTGKTASNEQANTMHHFIRKLIGTSHGAACAERMQLVYGGSCNAANAAELFDESDIDGGLIGGASLKEVDFKSIITAVQ